MKLVFLGPPGAGKGTMAFDASKEFGIPHISTGDIFRAAIRDKTPLGLSVKSILDSGALVTDELTVELVKERLSQADAKKGWILDGFPRTIPQAQALDGFSPADKVVNFEVSDAKVVERLAGRRMCRGCGKSYNVVTLRPAKEGVCDSCGGELYIRDDDKEEAIRNRLKVYRAQTEPLIGYYSGKGSLVTLDGSGDAKSVYAALLKVLR